MNIALDISPIEGEGSLYHRVRGTGSYVKNLKESLLKYFPENKYTFTSRREKISEDIDVIHYPYFEPFFLTLPFFNRTKFVVTVHDLTPLVFPKNFPSGIKGKLRWLVQKKILKKASRVITDSISSKNDIMKYGSIPEDKIDAIYLSAGEIYKNKKYSKEQTEAILNKYDLPQKFALYVGDTTWNKNLPRLIEASIFANTPLVMTGKALVNKEFDKSNPWNQDLVTVQKFASENKLIKRIGFVSDEDLVALYNTATVFLMPSLYEGFGLPILEAMSCGCPVITSKEGSLPEVAGEAAFYVDAYDADNIAQGIKKVWNDAGLRDKLISKGLMQAEKFSWRITADKTIKSYGKALSL